MLYAFEHVGELEYISREDNMRKAIWKLLNAAKYIQREHRPNVADVETLYIILSRVEALKK